MPEPSSGEKATYQQYVDAKAELNELMTRKKIVDKNLAGLENSIYAFEGSYLEDTLHGGNIIRGFDGYISNKPEKKLKYSDSDRLFSMSSTTFTKALQIKENPEPESSQDESKRSSSVSASNYKRPPKTSNSTSNSAVLSSSSASTATAGSSSQASSSQNRRLLKQPKPGKSSSDRPPKKMRLSSTGRDDGDEDLDV
ncbi:Chromatin modification- protein meaf6 [Gryganskiella cystojenkinii]|nr:Chromatin modification- protein meaf6 [Gryganskiella cystojenkinii]